MDNEHEETPPEKSKPAKPAKPAKVRKPEHSEEANYLGEILRDSGRVAILMAVATATVTVVYGGLQRIGSVFSGSGGSEED